MKKKIFKYFACMIAVAIVVTTVLLSWVNYGMFKNRVMDDLRTYGRVFSRILPDDEGTEEEESLARLTKEGLRVTLIHPDGSVYFDNFADPMTMENHGGFQQKNRNTCWDIIPIYLLMIKLSATKVYG